MNNNNDQTDNVVYLAPPASNTLIVYFEDKYNQFALLSGNPNLEELEEWVKTLRLCKERMNTPFYTLANPEDAQYPSVILESKNLA